MKKRDIDASRALTFEKDEQSTPRVSITQNQLDLRPAGSISDRCNCNGEKGKRRTNDRDRMLLAFPVPAPLAPIPADITFIREKGSPDIH